MSLNKRILLFDLDGTLLRSDKTISKRTLDVLHKCREKGFLIGISTSRSEINCLKFVPELSPDILVVSGGAIVKYGENYIYTAEFSTEETRNMIRIAREVCGEECEITIDTLHEHYWNYKVDPNTIDPSWGETIYTDYEDFAKKGVKVCVEIFDSEKASMLSERFVECDCVKFSDGDWYKFTKKEATKENAISKVCECVGITKDEIIAFGDDHVDIGMLKICGIGVAMGNSIEEVKQIADIVIGSNDEDGIAEYLERYYL